MASRVHHQLSSWRRRKRRTLIHNSKKWKENSFKSNPTAKKANILYKRTNILESREWSVHSGSHTFRKDMFKLNFLQNKSVTHFVHFLCSASFSYFLIQADAYYLSVTLMLTTVRFFLRSASLNSYCREERQEDQSSPVYNSESSVCLIWNGVCLIVDTGLQLISVNKPLITACNGLAVDCWGCAGKLQRWTLMNVQREQTETEGQLQ